MLEKDTVRREMKHLKDQLSEEDKIRQAGIVWQKIEAMERFVQAGTVLMYWSMPDELPTHDFILCWCTKKTIVLPVVDGDRLRLKLFEGKEYLRRNATMNLYEPQGDDYPTPSEIDMVIVPGMAFDRHNHRLGRGKGYYDKLLPRLRAYRVGVGFDFQLLDNIPFDEHDALMDEVVLN